MRALVTGGGGFLGKRVVELLLDAGHEVRFMARGSYPDVEALGAEQAAAASPAALRFLVHLATPPPTGSRSPAAVAFKRPPATTPTPLAVPARGAYQAMHPAPQTSSPPGTSLNQ